MFNIPLVLIMIDVNDPVKNIFMFYINYISHLCIAVIYDKYRTLMQGRYLHILNRCLIFIIISSCIRETGTL